MIFTSEIGMIGKNYIVGYHACGQKTRKIPSVEGTLCIRPHQGRNAGGVPEIKLNIWSIR